MSTSYEIRQMVETINSNFLLCVAQPINERLAKLEFETIVSQNPGKYFELIRITNTEESIKFTEICPNCDYVLPEGCKGLFENEKECRRNKQ